MAGGPRLLGEMGAGGWEFCRLCLGVWEAVCSVDGCVACCLGPALDVEDHAKASGLGPSAFVRGQSRPAISSLTENLHTQAHPNSKIGPRHIPSPYGMNSAQYTIAVLSPRCCVESWHDNSYRGAWESEKRSLPAIRSDSEVLVREHGGYPPTRCAVQEADLD